MRDRFLGKVAIVTGSSSGIGRATAILFAQEGAKVTITGRDAAALQVTKDECIKAGAKEGDILQVLGDITVEEIQDKLVDETVKKFGKLDVLVCNHGAGIKQHDEKGNLKMGVFDRVMDINCKSSLAMCVKAIPHLKATKGSIVNVSSNLSTIASPMSTFYSMAKASLDHMTRILAIEHAAAGIRVNCVNPGVTKTNLLTNIGFDKEMQEKILETVRANTVPCHRIGMPEDIAEVIAFLADNHSSGYVTGQTLIADGGMSLGNGENIQKELNFAVKPTATK